MTHTSPGTVQLLPCPFCDEQPSFTDVELKDERRYAQKLLRCCSIEMSASLSFGQYKGLTDAQIDHQLRSELVKEWNTRPQPLDVAKTPLDRNEELCDNSLARREEAGKAGAESVEQTSSELNHSPSGNLVPSRDSERKQYEPALEPGADKSEKGASPRSADELLTNASDLRAIHPRIEKIIVRHMGELMVPEDCARDIIAALPSPAQEVASPDYGKMSVDMAIEACAKVADSFACGVCGMDGKAGAAIRALSVVPSTDRDSAHPLCSCKASERDGQHMMWCPVSLTHEDIAPLIVWPSTGSFLGYRDASGNEMHCRHMTCPHEIDCRKRCICPTAVTSKHHSPTTKGD